MPYHVSVPFSCRSKTKTLNWFKIECFSSHNHKDIVVPHLSHEMMAYKYPSVTFHPCGNINTNIFQTKTKCSILFSKGTELYPSVPFSCRSKKSLIWLKTDVSPAHHLADVVVPPSHHHHSPPFPSITTPPTMITTPHPPSTTKHHHSSSSSSSHLFSSSPLHRSRSKHHSKPPPNAVVHLPPREIIPSSTHHPSKTHHLNVVRSFWYPPINTVAISPCDVRHRDPLPLNAGHGE